MVILVKMRQQHGGTKYKIFSIRCSSSSSPPLAGAATPPRQSVTIIQLLLLLLLLSAVYSREGGLSSDTPWYLVVLYLSLTAC